MVSGDGRDVITTGRGDDTVNAGGGRNTVNLGAGNDTAIHVVSDGGFSRYNGGRGVDTLQIVLSVEEAQDQQILSELARLYANLEDGKIKKFKSDILGLDVRKFEDVQIFAPVFAGDDFLTADEDTPLNLDVLANDFDLLGDTDNLSSDQAALTITSLFDVTAPGGVDPDALADRLEVAEDGKSITFNPAGLFDFLAAGQTADLSFTYEIADDQGYSATATATVTVVGVNDDALAGKAVDGYIAGATVFADANGNGVLDAGEATAITDTDGSFTLTGATGDLVLFGGTDVSTGLAFQGTLRAPEGSTVLTPITTLIVAFAELAGGPSPDFVQAEADVKAALGLPDLDLTSVDPVALAASGDGQGVDLLATQVKVQNTIVQAAAVVDGASGGSVGETV